MLISLFIAGGNRALTLFMAYVTTYELHASETSRQIRIIYILTLAMFFNMAFSLFILHYLDGTYWN